MKKRIGFVFIALIGTLLWPTLAGASAQAAASSAPVTSVILYLAVILIAAKLGGEIAVRIGQPAVLGELAMGVLLGNLSLLGVHALQPLATDNTLNLLAELGVLLLLFEVGLESTVGQMLKVGGASLRVAILGVVAPFALGWGVGLWFLPDASIYVHMFLGASLCATSVGITARVFKDLNAAQSNEARIILGAAVIDDVLGLIILAVVTGIIAAAHQGGAFSYHQITFITLKALFFLVGALSLGVYFSKRVFGLASSLKSPGVLLALALAFCFLLSWLSGAIGLAPIVGAFAAGLILENVHYQDFVHQGEHALEDLVHPISSFLVPIFFVRMGMHTDLSSFAKPGMLALALCLTLAAIFGKQLCSVGVSGKTIDRLTIGIGMIPRGEVGLIFANIGLGLTVQGERIVNDAVYSAIVVMVMITTMVTPPALKWSLRRTR